MCDPTDKEIALNALVRSIELQDQLDALHLEHMRLAALCAQLTGLSVDEIHDKLDQGRD